MSLDSVVPATPDVLEHLHRALDRLLPDPDLSAGRSGGFRSGITSAKIFVLDERAQHSGVPFHTGTTK